MVHPADIFVVKSSASSVGPEEIRQIASSQLPESTVVEPFHEEHDHSVLSEEIISHPSSATRSGSTSASLSSSMEVANTESEKQILESSALEQFFELQYFSCLNPFPIRYKMPLAVTLLQSVIFWMLSFLSFFYTVQSINYNIVNKSEKEVHRFIKIGMLALELMVGIYHVKVLMMNRQKILSAINQLDNLEEVRADINAKEIGDSSSHTNLYVRFFAFSCGPMIASCLLGIFGATPVEHWNMPYILYTSASDVGRTLFIWKPPENQTASLIRLEEDFLDQYDAVWITLGLFGVGCSISARLHEYAMRNLMISMELSLLRHTNSLKDSVKARNISLIRTVSNGPIPSHVKAEKTWKYYFLIRKLSQDLNDCFGTLTGIVQFKNMLAIVYYALLLILHEHSILSFCLSLYDTGLILFSFYCATKISTVNAVLRKWIKNNTLPSSPIVVDGTTLHVLLDDIKDTPIGIGSGDFFVDGGFLNRFVGLTVSFLMYMVDAEGESGR